MTDKNHYPTLKPGKLYEVIFPFVSYTKESKYFYMSDCMIYLYDYGGGGTYGGEPMRRFLYKNTMVVLARHVDISIFKYLKEIS